MTTSSPLAQFPPVETWVWRKVMFNASTARRTSWKFLPTASGYCWMTSTLLFGFTIKIMEACKTPVGWGGCPCLTMPIVEAISEGSRELHRGL